MSSLKRLSLLTLPALTALLPAQYLQQMQGAVPAEAPEVMVFDTLRDRSVALIGTSTWEHDGSGWSLVPTVHVPSDRYEYAMCFDGQRVLLYGGELGTAAGSDLWAYDGVDWTLLSNGQGPGPRRGAAMSFDLYRQRVVLFGGTDMLGNFPTDTWEWDGSAWSQSPATGPNSRVWHRMVFDETTGRTVMCGGAFNPITYLDTWEYDGTTWTQTVTNQFPYSLLPGLVFDRSTQRVLVLGGWTGSLTRQEVYAYDAAASTWNLVLNAPAFQYFLGAAYDPYRQRTVVMTSDLTFGFGGPPATYYYRDQGTGAASFSAYGFGCQGAGGVVPSLAGQAGSVPTIGSSFTAEVSPVGAGALAMFAVGLSSTQANGVPLPADLGPIGLPGCWLQTSAEAIVLMTPGAGVATLTWPLPNLAALAGTTFFSQALVIDPAAPNGFGAISNGAIGVLQ